MQDSETRINRWLLGLSNAARRSSLSAEVCCSHFTGTLVCIILSRKKLSFLYPSNSGGACTYVFKKLSNLVSLPQKTSYVPSESQSAQSASCGRWPLVMKSIANVGTNGLTQAGSETKCNDCASVLKLQYATKRQMNLTHRKVGVVVMLCSAHNVFAITFVETRLLSSVWGP